MKNRLGPARSILLALALTVLGAGAATAQSQVQTTDELKFEVISVDGNNLVVRDQNGTRAVTVPENFKFTVDGKSLSVHDLKPGMKGTATVTTTMSFRPVYVTQVKKGTVVRQVGTSVHVRTDEGVRWFKKADIARPTRATKPKKKVEPKAAKAKTKSTAPAKRAQAKKARVAAKAAAPKKKPSAKKAAAKKASKK